MSQDKVHINAKYAGDALLSQRIPATIPSSAHQTLPCLRGGICRRSCSTSVSRNALSVFSKRRRAWMTLSYNSRTIWLSIGWFHANTRRLTIRQFKPDSPAMKRKRGHLPARSLDPADQHIMIK